MIDKRAQNTRYEGKNVVRFSTSHEANSVLENSEGGDQLFPSLVKMVAVIFFAFIVRRGLATMASTFAFEFFLSLFFKCVVFA